MTNHTVSLPAGRVLIGVLALFVGSGAAALIYEIVWFQLLEFVIGASGVSIGVLLGTFMGGMFLGSLLLPRHVPRASHPLVVYGALELGIGAFGLVLLFVIPTIGGAYQTIVPHGWAGVVLRAVLCALCLLPPTILMGATLPAVSRYVRTTRTGVAWMGFFYGGNIAGAVVGALVAGFYLLRVHDIPTATGVGVAVNVTVATLAFLLARAAPYEPDPRAEAHAPLFTPGRHAVYVAIGLSGLTALGAQVIWTRLLSLLLGATTYTFSIILAVFLAMLGVGSAIGSYLSKVVPDPRRAFASCQLLVGLALAWTAWVVARALPYWPIDPSISSSPWVLFQVDLWRAVVALSPAPLLWGASFPLAVAAASAPGQDPGRLVGGVYAANTVGAIAGATGFGLLVIPLLGTQTGQQLLALTALFAAGTLVVGRRPVPGRDGVGDPGAAPEAGLERPSEVAGFDRPGVEPVAPLMRFRAASPGSLAFTGGAVVVLAAAIGIPAVPPVLVAYGRYAATYEEPDALYVGEGMNSSVAVTELSNGDRNIHIGGKIVASTEPQDMRLQRMLGHMTALLHDDPRSVLVVGFGAGVTAGTFVTHPGIERIVIVEIEPLVTDVAWEHFKEANHFVLDDPRVEVVHDDARHYLLTTDESFDLITGDPIHPWMKGAAALYTLEYFEQARSHLNPGGVITQWVPLYESSAEVVKSEFRTFFEVFPNGVVWSNTYNGQGYDVVLSGTAGTTTFDVDRLATRLEAPDHAIAFQSLQDVGFFSIEDLLGTYAGRAEDLGPWVEDGALNRDRDLRLMYLAGLSLNRYEQDDILDEILEFRVFPYDLFEGTPPRIGRLVNRAGFR